uniref:sensor histidine kinase n=1 Tax=Sporichthya sp. TaxID=65475 RepID=UPI00180DAF91
MGPPARRALVPAVAVTLWLTVLVSLGLSLWIDHRVETAGRPDLGAGATEIVAFGGAAFTAATIGALLAVRRSPHPVGWLFLALATTLGLSAVGDSYGSYAVLARPGAWPAGEQVATLSSGVWLWWFVILGLILLLTPTGCPVSPAWGRAVWASLAVGALAYGGFLLRPGKLKQAPFESVTNPWGIERLDGLLGPTVAISAGASGMLFIAGGISLIVRFRRAQGDERRQLLWLALVVIPLPLYIGGSFVAAGTGHETVLGLLTAGYLLLIPIAAALSIARYRLYDVDRILTRAATYSLLSLLLAGVYVATVLFAVWSLRDVSGSSQIATAVATLATAAAAAPARRWLQAGMDRRFSRRRFAALELVRNALRGAAATRDVDTALRLALADPGLRVAYLVAPDGTWVSAAGDPVTPAPDEVVVERFGVPVASIAFDPDQVGRELVVEVAAEAGAELEAVGLRAAVALQLAEVRLSRARIVETQLAERHRIERNLHDGAQQRLLALAFQLRAAQLRTRSPELAVDLDRAVTELQTAVGELRALANGLHPAILVDGGLAAALEDLAARSPVPVRLDVGPERFPPACEAAAWFVACEAVANAVKHARATGVEVGARADADRLLV